MDGFGDARWYAIRPAGSTKPATYRCPVCRREEVEPRRPGLLSRLLRRS